MLMRNFLNSFFNLGWIISSFMWKSCVGGRLILTEYFICRHRVILPLFKYIYKIVATQQHINKAGYYLQSDRLREKWDKWEEKEEMFPADL